MDQSIKYIFIGDINKKVEVVDYPPNVNKQIAIDCRSIFDRLLKQKSQAYDERFKIVSSFGVFHFTIYPSNTLYLVLAVPNYPEKDVFDLINEFHDKEIYMNVNEKGEITTKGKSKFNDIISRKRTTSSAMERTKVALDDVKIEMRKGINNAMRNIEDVQELEVKAQDIARGAEMMKDAAKKLSCCAWLRNFKWTIIIVSIVIGVLLIIIVPVAITLTNEAKAKEALMGMGSNTNNNTTNIIVNPSPSPSPTP